jgi:hypothetical protein
MEQDRLLVHLTPSQTYRVVCSQCQHVTEGHANDFPADSSNSFVVDCSCGHSFKVLLNCRAHYRKPTRLPGEVTLVQGGRTIGEVCTVLDLSNTGMRLRARFLANMQEGQPITVTVTLDDSPRTRLPLPCVVRWMKLRQKQAIMGVQFAALDPHQLQALGFYLL